MSLRQPMRMDVDEDQRQNAGLQSARAANATPSALRLRRCRRAATVSISSAGSRSTRVRARTSVDSTAARLHRNRPARWAAPRPRRTRPSAPDRSSPAAAVRRSTVVRPACRRASSHPHRRWIPVRRWRSSRRTGPRCRRLAAVVGPAPGAIAAAASEDFVGVARLRVPDRATAAQRTWRPCGGRLAELNVIGSSARRTDDQHRRISGASPFRQT